MFPNPGAVNNLLLGRYREPAFVGMKNVSNNDGGVFAINLSSISGIQPGDFCFMALSRHALSQGLSGGDGGWVGYAYPPTGSYFTNVVYWQKGNLTANDIANTKIMGFGGYLSVADVMIYRNVKRAVLRTSNYYQNGFLPNPPPFIIPGFTRSSDALGVMAHLYTLLQPYTITGPMSLYPSTAAMTERMSVYNGDAFRTYAADMLTNVSLFGQEVRAAGAASSPSFHLGTHWELRAT